MEKHIKEKSEQLQSLKSNSYKSFKLKSLSPNRISILQSDYRVGIIAVNKGNGEIAFIKKDADLFRKENGFGVLLEVVEKDLLFDRMLFRYRNHIYETTRAELLKYGKIRSFREIGKKIFISIDKMRCLTKRKTDDNQLDLFDKH